jgi:mannose-6-phosphate isomerase
MVWGGRKLEEFGKQLPSAERYGESWEISAHSLAVSRVQEGPLAGTTLTDLCENHWEELFGKRPKGDGKFPLLIKLLDCHELLSIQVHPDDQLAAQILGDELGKTEAWIILDVGPEGRVFAGLKEGVTREILQQHLQAGTTDQCLHSFQPKVGDCLFLPAGTVHAVGGGVVMAEVQQSSDATFRLFDWNRVGSDGQPRALHIEESLAAINFAAGPQEPLVEHDPLVSCRYFRLRKLILRTAVPPKGELSVYMILNGSAELAGAGYQRSFSRGETVLIPASASELAWSIAVNSVLLEITLPA